MTGSLVANLMLTKSLVRSQGGLTDVYVRVVRIEPGPSLVRNLNHINAVHINESLREGRRTTCPGSQSPSPPLPFSLPCAKSRCHHLPRPRLRSIGLGRRRVRENASVWPKWSATTSFA